VRQANDIDKDLDKTSYDVYVVAQMVYTSSSSWSLEDRSWDAAPQGLYIYGDWYILSHQLANRIRIPLNHLWRTNNPQNTTNALIEKSNKNHIRSIHHGASSHNSVLAKYLEIDPLAGKRILSLWAECSIAQPTLK
jgi:hypothetical protein